MSLIGQILKRGLTLPEIKDKIKKEGLDITKEVIDKELLKEKDRILTYLGNNQKEKEKIERLFRVISNQSVVDGKISVLEREYKSNGGQLKAGYISNLFYFGNLEENKYLMTYIFNRLKNQKNLTLEGYNLEYFRQEERGVFDIITKATESPIQQRTESFENWLRSLDRENETRRAEERKRKALRKKREELGESPIDKMILEMLGNAKNAKVQKPKSSEDDVPGDEEY